MLNYKYLLLAGGLSLALIPENGRADTCSTLPNCTDIGFVVSAGSLSSKCSGKTYLKCPFGEYYFCSETQAATKTCQEAISGLTGSIYYNKITASYLTNASSSNTVYFDTDETFTSSLITLKDKARINGASFYAPYCNKTPTLELSTLSVQNIEMNYMNLKVAQLNLQGVYAGFNQWNGVPASISGGEVVADITSRIYVQGPTWLDLQGGSWNIKKIDFSNYDGINPLIISVTDADVTIDETQYTSGKQYLWALCLDSSTSGESTVTVGGRTYEWTDSGERTVSINGSVVKEFNYMCSSEIYHVEDYGQYRVYYGPCYDLYSSMPSENTSMMKEDLNKIINRDTYGYYWECTN